MSILLFMVGDTFYGINASDILRVIPNVRLKKNSHSKNDFISILNLEGKPVLVVDFCHLIEQREASNFMHSRIILIKETTSNSENIIGILGERVENMINLEPEQFSKIEIQHQTFPFLDKVYADQNKIIHLLNINELFHYLSIEITQASNEKAGFQIFEK